jgi:DNA-binding transcriptional MerR regulator
MPTPRRHADRTALLSIGALSASTGIPADTLRTWKRRYGFPKPQRRPSGHRVYPLEAVPRLRRIARALARGHRAAQVVPASERTLEALLEDLGPAPQPPTPPAGRRRPSAAAAEVAALVAAARAFDGERLTEAWQVDWARLGPLEFVQRRAAPFLVAVGDAWAAGELDVRHEHFASAALGDFLRTIRLPHDDRATGPLVALSTLPGERHVGGLQMAALVFAVAGWRVLYLGAETPADQLAYHGDGAEIGALRRKLPRGVALVRGGSAAAAARGLANVETIRDLEILDRWARERVR